MSQKEMMMTIMNNTYVERRLDRKVRAFQCAAVLCALFAAMGIAHGMHGANPAGGWFTPACAGVAAATTFAIFWHVLIGSVAGMIRTTTTIAIFLLAILLTAVALGASAQAIATAISGKSALTAELSEQVDDYNHALAAAYAEATGWNSVASAAGAKAAGLRKQAEMETTGANGAGKGCGPRCASLQDISGAFQNAYEALGKLLEDAATLRQKGNEGMAQLRTAASNGDQVGFMAAADQVASVIAELNAVDPLPIVTSTGAVTVSDKGIDLTAETREFQAVAKQAMAERETVDAPTFHPITLGDATRSQAMGAAAHGWVMAGAIDILPLILLIVAFALSREVWFHQPVERSKLTPEGRNKRDRDQIDDLHNGSGKDNVVKLQAGE